MKQVMLYEWADSQICISCPLGVFTDPEAEKIGSSAYICLGNKIQGDNCIPFERMVSGIDDDDIYNNIEE